MTKYMIRYGLGGGFGGAGEWKPTDAETLEQAQKWAYEAACAYYEMYNGFHELRNTHQIMDEEECDENEAEEIWRDERESWLDYEAREISEIPANELPKDLAP